MSIDLRPRCYYIVASGRRRGIFLLKKPSPSLAPGIYYFIGDIR